MEKKIELELRRSDKIMTTWEVTSFINNLSEGHYKLEILNSLIECLQDKEILRNIFIMDSSFNAENIYPYMKQENLKIQKNIMNLYHLGNPISFGENQILRDIELLFKTLKKANQLLGKNKINYFKNREKYYMYYKMIKENKIKEVLEEAKLEIREMIKIKGLNKQIEEKVLVQLEKIFTDEQNKYIKQKQTKDNVDNFFNIFSNRARPIIGVYIQEKDEIVILNKEFINKKSNNKKLDLKKIEHSSPTVAILSLGVISALYLYPLIEGLISKNNSNPSMQEELEKQKIYLDSFERKLNKIENERVKNKIIEQKNSNLVKVNKTLVKNKMVNKDLKAKVKE